ncbi:ABC transporter substrate-binding protein [Nocardia sp. BMG111209]|uniref:ABC transporter substrate-binding protein n=1 Tax=Nocardia sp. BMG111209 TaxID=1160137 RepID=UPI00035C4F78|nr:ABC transporter substrate-binding protein [Nocardia sp. BMG111209]
MRRAWYLAVAVTAATALTATACAKDGGGTGTGSKTISLGMVVAETGPIAGAGKTFANGARIAAQEINDGDLIGGGTKIELVAKEGSEDPAKSAGVVSQLVADKDVVGVACCILSTVAGAAKPIADKQKVPLVLWGATDVNLAEPPYVFRTVTMPQPANEKLAQTVAAQKKPATVAYGVMTDNSGIVSQAEAFEKGMTEAGVRNVGQVDTLSTQTNFTGAATDLIQKNADAIVVVGTQSNAVGLIAALHDKGYAGQIVSGETISGTGVYKSQPAALGNVPFPVYFLASSATGAGKTFAADYKAKYGDDPDDYAAQGFTAIYTLAMGLKAAGHDTTRAGLAKALGQMTELDTVYGKVTFDHGQLNAAPSVQAVHYTAPDGAIAPWTPSN